MVDLKLFSDQQLVDALRACASADCAACERCPVYEDADCSGLLITEAANRIAAKIET